MTNNSENIRNSTVDSVGKSSESKTIQDLRKPIYIGDNDLQKVDKKKVSKYGRTV